MLTFLQMDSEEGLVSQLLGDGGGQQFFVDVLLLLNPEDLKACRQVDDFSKKILVSDKILFPLSKSMVKKLKPS